MKEGVSRQNCIFGCSFMERKVVIHLFQKTSALSAPVSLESDGRMATRRLTKKLRRGATKLHPYAARNPDNGVVVVQSKAIRKHLHIGHLVSYHNSKQSLLINFG